MEGTDDKGCQGRSANIGCRKVWELWGSGSELNCRFNGDTFTICDSVKAEGKNRKPGLRPANLIGKMRGEQHVKYLTKRPPLPPSSPKMLQADVHTEFLFSVPWTFGDSGRDPGSGHCLQPLR